MKLFAIHFWTRLPVSAQKRISGLFAALFRKGWSRLLIVPYCLLMGLDGDDLAGFEPDSGQARYQSYEDFFKRRYKTFPVMRGAWVWPCEGYVCDWGRFGERALTRVKGQELPLSRIFHPWKNPAEQTYFVNIFLHNHNYHRVHAPVAGKILSLQRIPGDLVFLRPWFYSRSEVSRPAFQNERLTVEIEDRQGRSWWLSMVGGFGVGSIELTNETQVGSFVELGQELGWFNLGSTVCLASPEPLVALRYLQTVKAGESLPVQARMDDRVSSRDEFSI